MRFGVVSSDSESDSDILSVDYSFSSDEETVDGFQWISTNANPSLGRDIRNALDSSDEEVFDSEDEVEILGLSGKCASGGKNAGKARALSPWNAFSIPQSSKNKGKSAISSSLWRHSPLARSLSGRKVSSSKATLEEVLKEEPDVFETWVKKTEEDAWRDGQYRAAKQQSHVRSIATDARAKIVSIQESQLLQEAEEIRQLLEGLALRHDKQEEELRKAFKEREESLWKDIDEVIRSVEKREAEAAAKAARAAQAEAMKRQEEEDARIAERDRVAREQKAEIERRAKELALKEQQATAVKEAEERRLEEEKRAKEEKEKASKRITDKRGEAGATWNAYTEKQSYMKSEVIEKVKGDRPTMTNLNKGKRMIIRWLGQALNTRESVVKITTDIHDLLIQQLPSLPSPSSPIQFTPDIPKAYAYLLSHVSKVLITQAQSEITSKPTSAFPLAKVVVGLMLRGHAALGDILFARLVKKCPWVVPFYPAPQADQNREDYEKSTGRGADESQHEYISRMSSICTLYFAILQTPLTPLIPTLPSAPTPEELDKLVPKPMRLTYAWTWLALALRDPMPASPPIATLLTTWIEIALAEVIRIYGKVQTDKLRECLEREGIQGVKIKGDGGMSRDKLAFVLDKWRSGGDLAMKGRDWTV
ncbi:hypothetical protein I308_105526 [Cryptococcus tetragattii IND107]|uniref:mRNA export factor GLE1 n=1 Tax=Cryptococcus tetragattii IND107 TaxID=1296105 RepID=A0ABR3BLQ8_9TREE|nr:hypothetical protein I308_03559 [Cryptococcus tetragattii IND107]